MNARLTQGSEFAGHRIEGELGRGGMGIVYRAIHISLDQLRALKVIDPRLLSDGGAAERFRREARLAASVDHPAVVRVYDAGEVDGTPYISMQLIDGVDLATLIGNSPPGAGRSLAILSQIASGLDAAHGAGLVHRDVKPANILLAATGERAYLGDFGIGLLTDRGDGDRLTAESRLLGTAAYVSPEQIEGGPIDVRADIYSLGCVAFELLTGSVPFPAETQLATLSAHGSAPRPRASERNPDLPDSVDPVLAAAIAIDPAERPASAVRLVRALEAALGDPAPAPGERVTVPLRATRRARRSSTTPIPRRPRRRRGRLLLAAAAVVLAIAAFAGGLVLAGDEAGIEQGSAAVTFDVPRDPVSVAAGAEFVWVASRAAGRVRGFEAGSGKRSELSYRVDGPRAIALGPGALWAVGPSSLIRLGIDDERKQAASVELFDAADVAVGRNGGDVWVLDRGGEEAQARVVRVDARSLEQTGEAYVGTDPQGIAAGAGGIWVTNTGDGTVSLIDPRQARAVGRPIAVGGRPEAIAASGGRVLVVDNFGGRLIEIDPSGEEPSVRGATETLPRPRGVALGFGSAWVASGEDGVVQRFDAEAGRALRAEYEVGADPADVTVGSGRVWSADSDSDTVSGIDP